MIPLAARNLTIVRVDDSTGLCVLELLGPRCGGVIADPDQSALYWFVEPLDAEGWGVVGASTMAVEALPSIPSPETTRGPGPHWRMCPADGDWRTDPTALRAAIADTHAAPNR